MSGAYTRYCCSECRRGLNPMYGNGLARKLIIKRRRTGTSTGRQGGLNEALKKGGEPGRPAAVEPSDDSRGELETLSAASGYATWIGLQRPSPRFSPVLKLYSGARCSFAMRTNACTSVVEAGN